MSKPKDDEHRYASLSLHTMATVLFMGAGLDEDKASTVAHYLVVADEIAHSTHSLAMAAWYMQMLSTSDMANSGEIKPISD